MAFKLVEIRIRLDAVKFAKLLELMPEHEKGKDQNTKPIYWAVDFAIAAKLKELSPVSQNISNREYLRRNP